MEQPGHWALETVAANAGPNGSDIVRFRLLQRRTTDGQSGDDDDGSGDGRGLLSTAIVPSIVPVIAPAGDSIRGVVGGDLTTTGDSLGPFSDGTWDIDNEDDENDEDDDDAEEEEEADLFAVNIQGSQTDPFWTGWPCEPLTPLVTQQAVHGASAWGVMTKDDRMREEAIAAAVEAAVRRRSVGGGGSSTGGVDRGEDLGGVGGEAVLEGLSQIDTLRNNRTPRGAF